MDAVPGFTDRGFAKVLFHDHNNVVCSLQASSLATEACIWLGLEKAEPIILARQRLAGAHKALADCQLMGLGPSSTGWVPYPIPSEVQISTRMHLNQEQVRWLLPLLQAFADTGDVAPMIAAMQKGK